MARTKDENAIIDDQIRKGFRKLFWKTPFNHNTDVAAAQAATFNNLPSRTQRHQAADTDINVIMRKFGVTGVAPGAKYPPSFQDIPEDMDMQKAIEIVRQGYEAFETQPANIRALYRNDMALYAAHVEHLRATGDTEALEGLGLLKKTVLEPPPSATVQAEPPQPAKKPATPEGGKD